MTQSTYQLLDAGNFRKLEQVGPFRIIRPSPQAVWQPYLPASEWHTNICAEFERYASGDGNWKIVDKRLHEPFTIEVGDIAFVIKLTDFGHLGLFPEQRQNWARLAQVCKASDTPLRILNLFAYTGGSTLASCTSNAELVHIDASKTSVAWARENADASGLADRPVRWIVDDVKKFVARELRRGNRYHGIILDPPSYGRGNKGEVWKIEDDLPPLLNELDQLLAEDWRFVLLSAHSPGYTPIALKNLLAQLPQAQRSACTYLPEEMLIQATRSDIALPSGNSCWLYRGAISDLEL